MCFRGPTDQYYAERCSSSWDVDSHPPPLVRVTAIRLPQRHTNEAACHRFAAASKMLPVGTVALDPDRGCGPLRPALRHWIGPALRIGLAAAGLPHPDSTFPQGGLVAEGPCPGPSDAAFREGTPWGLATEGAYPHKQTHVRPVNTAAVTCDREKATNWGTESGRIGAALGGRGSPKQPKNLSPSQKCDLSPDGAAGGASKWSGCSVRITLWPRLPHGGHRLLSIKPQCGASTVRLVSIGQPSSLRPLPLQALRTLQGVCVHPGPWSLPSGAARIAGPIRPHWVGH